MKVKETSDTILVERVQRGESLALDKLIARHQDRAYRYAYRLAHDRDDAADIVANAFVRIYRAIDSFKNESAFTTWLYRIITNCYFDLKMRENRLQTVSFEFTAAGEGDSLEFEIEDESGSAFEEVVRQEKNILMNRYLEQIPEYQKIILTLYHVQMLSYEEIAEILELPMGTVKSRMNRARASLSGALADHRSMFDDTFTLDLAAA